MMDMSSVIDGSLALLGMVGMLVVGIATVISHSTTVSTSSQKFEEPEEPRAWQQAA